MSSRPQPRRHMQAAGRKHQTSSSPQARKHIVRASPQVKEKEALLSLPVGAGQTPPH